jgi:tripartite ATP-independent transporter DctP family solute receptor
MTTRRHFIALSGAALATPAILGKASAQAVTLRSADTHPDGYPTVEAVKFMGQLIEQRTNGRIKIQVFHSSQLGQEADTLTQTRLGVIDMNRINLGPLNNLVATTAIPALPFIFRSVNHMRAVMDGEIGNSMLTSVEPHNMIGLGFYDSGARSFYNGKRAIRTPADMAGLKIRVQQSDLFVSLVQALGANPTPMPFGEVFSALQTGVIDGAENNWPSYESTRHFEVSKFYSMTEHSMSPEVLVMSKRAWDRLSPADREIVRAAAKESVPHMRKLWDAREESARKNVEARGAQVNMVEKQPFIDAMRGVYQRFAGTPELQGLVARIQSVSA